MQRRHFLLFDVVPAVGTLIAFAILPWLRPQGADLLVFAVLWLATGLGLTVGFHRYFSHRSFAAARPVVVGLLIMGSMAARGPMVSWVSMHRRHHELSDREGDLHSPNLHGSGFGGRLRGWWHAHIAWMIHHDYPNVARYVPDLLADRALMPWNRLYYLWVILGLAIPTVVGGLAAGSWEGLVTGFLWGGLVRIFVVEQTMSAINSFCHMMGEQAFDRHDNSRNNFWLGLLSWGESHHNNHHAWSNSAAFGLRWYEFDPGFWCIRALQTLGLVWDVRVPSKDRIAARRELP
jgi:stearoyl-CoA desaturase (delta-9 desaturase)